MRTETTRISQLLDFIETYGFRKDINDNDNNNNDDEKDKEDKYDDNESIAFSALRLYSKVFDYQM